MAAAPPPQEDHVNVDVDHLSQSSGSMPFIDDPVPQTELNFDSLDDFWLQGQIGNLEWLG